MSSISRRQFLKLSSAAAVAGGLLPNTALASEPVFDADYGMVTKVPMMCRMCAQYCPMIGHVAQGRLVRVESNKNSPHPGICGRGRAAIGALYSPDRIKTPLIRVGERGEGKFREATWDEALNLVADKLKALKAEGEERAVAYLPRFSSANGLDKEFFSIYGTPNVVGYGDTCFGNSLTVSYGAIMGGKDDKGVPTAGTGDLTPDYEHAEYGLLISRNPGGGLVAFPWGAMYGIGKKNGLKVTVIDPRRPSEAGESDMDWLPIRPGTDLAFLLGLMHVIYAKNYFDEAFVRKYTNGEMLIDVATGLPVKMEKGEKHTDYLVYDDVASAPVLKSVAERPALFGSFTIDGKEVKTAMQMLKDGIAEYTPAWAEGICGVSAAQIEAVAEKLKKAMPKVFIERGYRSCRYAHSMKEKQVIIMLNALMGAIGTKGGMIMQRGAALGGYMKAPKPEEISIGKYYRKHNPEFALSNTGHYRRTYFKAILEGKPYPSKVAIIYGQNPVGGSSGGYIIAEALQKLDLIVDINPFYSETNMYADVILPECTFMERDEAIQPKWKSPYPFIAVHRKAVEPLYESKSGYWIFNELARKTFPQETYQQYYGDYDARGIVSIWEKQLAGLDKLSDEEKATFSPESLFRAGTWFGKTKYGTKAKTSTGKIEIYSTFFAQTFADMKAAGNPQAEYASPLANYVEPFWRLEKKELGEDEFLPATGFSPLNSFTGNQTRNNPLLAEVGEKLDVDAVFINAARGKKLGLKDGDTIEIANIKLPEMKTQARVKLSETIQPDTLFAYYGSGAGFFKKQTEYLRFDAEAGFNPNHVSDFTFAPLDGGQPAQDFIVKIGRVK